MKEIIDELKENKDVRSNLSKLRQEIKDETKKAQCISKEYTELFVRFLASEDAKTRKNAALLLGDLGCQEALDDLWNTFLNEKVEFVKGAYLESLGKLQVEKYWKELMELLQRLTTETFSEENKKHVEEQIRALRKMQIAKEGIKRHTFRRDAGATVVLTCNREMRDILRRSITFGHLSTHPLGVLVETDHVGDLLSIRTYREILFPIPTGRLLDPDPMDVASQLWNARLWDLLCSLHKEDDPFYFRIELKNSMNLEERSAFSRKLASQLEQLSGGKLINSTGDYEVEIRLVANKEGKLLPCLKLYSIHNKRFAYRKNAIATSIHPATAALMMELAEPYLQENAQIMDPFCGVGTMLIERYKKVRAREIYATDIFGDAITFGRENAKLAGIDINFIHRDFFDFKHDYLFDEIITNMPARGKRSKEEMDEFYQKFFEKIATHMVEGGVILMYTNEIGFVKKQLRLHKEFHLKEEYLMQKKNDYYFLIIEMRG